MNIFWKTVYVMCFSVGLSFIALGSEGVVTDSNIALKYNEGSSLSLELIAKAWGDDFTVKAVPQFHILMQKVNALKGDVLKFRDFIPDKSSFKQGGQDFFASFHAIVEGGRVEVETAIRASDNKFRWTITVNNKSAVPVLEVTFPVLKNLSFSDDGKDDELLWPLQSTLKDYSMIVRNPAEKLPPGPSEYPRSSLNFVDLSGNGRGMTIIGPKELIFRKFVARKSITQRAIDVSTTMINSIMPNKKATYEFIIYPHGGDWRKGADIYRGIFRKRFGIPNYPEWVKYSNGFYAVSWIGGNLPYDTEMRCSINETWRLGLEQLQLWGQTGQSACPAYPLPDPVKGGETTFTNTMNEIVAAGLKPGAYFWSCGIGEFEAQSDSFRGVKWSSYPKELRPPSWDWVVRYSQYDTPARNKPQKEIGLNKILAKAKVKTLQEAEERKLVPQVLHKMMFHSEEYQKWLLFWINRYVCNYDIRVPYLDVFGLRPKHREFNPHMQRWGDGTEGIYRYKFLKMLNSKFRPQYPDFVPMMEGTIDCYNTQATALISNFRSGTMPVYRYVFPEMILYEGMSNGHWNKSISAISNAYLDGNRFDLLEKWIPSEVDHIVWLRDSLIKFIADATYIGDPSVKISSGKIQTALLDASERYGIKLLNFRNIDKEEGVKAVLPEDLIREVTGGFILSPSGKMTRLDKFDTITIPPFTVSTLILYGRKVSDSAKVIPVVFSKMTESSIHFNIHLINLSNKSQRVKQVIRFASDGNIVYPQKIITLPPHGTVSVTEMMPFHEFGDRAQRLWFNFTWAKTGACQLRRLYEPPFEDAGFEWDNKSRPLSTDIALEGKSSLAIEGANGVLPYFKPVPNARNKVSVYVYRIDGSVPSIAIFERKNNRIIPLRRTRTIKNGWTKYETEFIVKNNSNYRLAFRNYTKKGTVYYDKLTFSVKK